MTYEQYIEQRKNLLNEAETLLNDGKLEDFEAKEQEIKDLDAKYEAVAKAQANMNALKEPAVSEPVVNMSKGDDGIVAKNEPIQVQNKEEVYLNAWAKDMMGMKLEGDEKTVFEDVNNEFRNQTQTAADHVVLIPETVRDGIWKEAGDLFPILGDVRMTFVPGDLTILKEENSGDDAAWYDEDTEVTDGDLKIGELNLTGCELAKNVPISWKLRKMSIKEFIAYITSLLAEKMGAALAKAIVHGKGKPGTEDSFKPEPKGIITSLEAEADTPQIVEYTDKPTYQNVTTLMGKVKSAYKSGASIYANAQTVWNYLANIVDENKRPIFIPDATSGGVGRIFGLIVKEDDSIGEGEVLVGNVGRGYVMNVNENMTIYTEEHIKKRRTDYMGYAIVDGDVLTNKAFALLRKTLPAG